MGLPLVELGVWDAVGRDPRGELQNQSESQGTNEHKKSIKKYL